MITENKITEIFCLADEFCKYFSSELKNHQIGDGKGPGVFPMPRSSPY